MISSLLTSHSHLLRPRDAPILQKAISLLASLPQIPNQNQTQNQTQISKYTLQALRILEKEMTETVITLRASLLPLFSGLSDVDKCMVEMGVIARMRAASAARVDRIERWVDGVSTPRVGGDGNANANAGGPPPPHPMALAAFMMGLPVFPGALGPDDSDEEDADTTDPFGYFDSLDSSSAVDPELEDLREELRPRIKERFDGWVEVGSVMPGGAGVLLRVYIKILGLMPFFRAGDVVDEIISRLSEKPSKHYICVALDTVAAFCKLQKKVVLREKKRKAAAATNANANANASTSRSHAASSVNQGGAIPTPARSLAGIGGIDDVD
ncbi:hypothetical protein PILCRDRAFT_607121 [Piloderma croceum F 1598]|uniref:Uncharacterized protein n=1 Tax=Piloderma croceum (strain F 1598) TaxID=765440 RepID=A0A0C3FDS8_PILCF|nr:hypothetical protein PILCRDRAFT_607121 [Piloderma croceum F 1598]